MTRLGQAFQIQDLEVVRMPLEELTVSVASPATLHRMKRDTVRLKDKADAELLRPAIRLEGRTMTPVRKFRSVEEMESPIWRRPGDPDLYRAIALVWAFGRRTAPRRFPPGVHRHRSIEQLDRQVEEWSVADFEALRRSTRQRSM